MHEFDQQLAAGVPLADDQIAQAVAQLLDPAVADTAKADFLCALARKGETAPEITTFARELRAKSITPPLDAATRAREILDVCGTGGDRLNTFNISTTSAIVAAAAGAAATGAAATATGAGLSARRPF